MWNPLAWIWRKLTDLPKGSELTDPKSPWDAYARPFRRRFDERIFVTPFFRRNDGSLFRIYVFYANFSPDRVGQGFLVVDENGRPLDRIEAQSLVFLIDKLNFSAFPQTAEKWKQQTYSHDHYDLQRRAHRILAKWKEALSQHPEGAPLVAALTELGEVADFLTEKFEEANRHIDRVLELVAEVRKQVYPDPGKAVVDVSLVEEAWSHYLAMIGCRIASFQRGRQALKASLLVRDKITGAWGGFSRLLPREDLEELARFHVGISNVTEWEHYAKYLKFDPNPEAIYKFKTPEEYVTAVYHWDKVKERVRNP